MKEGGRERGGSEGGRGVKKEQEGWERRGGGKEGERSEGKKERRKK